MNASQCPWSGYAPATMEFCESRLCAWIVEPSNTWSNLAYIFIGIYILWLERKNIWNPLQTIGYTSILVGIGSFAFHATGTFWGEFLDLSAMFLIGGQFITFNIARARRFSDVAIVAMYVAICSTSMLLLYNFRPWGIALFIIMVVVAAALEFYLFRRDGKSVRYKNLGILALFFALSFLFWRMDFRKIWCDPNNHLLTGHAIWHILNSFCLLFFYKFHQQFLEKRHT